MWVVDASLVTLQASLYPGEEDIENWLFGESTMSALLTYQVGSDGVVVTFLILLMMLNLRSNSQDWDCRGYSEEVMTSETC